MKIIAEKFKVEKDIKVFCVRAKTFPEGIQAAHEAIYALFPVSDKRRYFGISHPDVEGHIIYLAAAQVLQTDKIQDPELETFVIKAGEFSSVVIANFAADISQIGRVFDELLQDPRLDPEGYCLEWYFTANDVRCMVPLDSDNADNKKEGNSQ